MASFEPYESRPRIAVAVSGGADSMALCLLLDEWSRKSGADIVGLTVDHGLRSAAAAEARRVGDWLRRSDIAHETVRWVGDKPHRGVQAAARDARYRLLTDWCREHAVLHLALGHHLNDQAETLLLRLAAGSGPDGLAGMAAQAEAASVRLLRPLLTLPKARLEATLDARGQSWLDDPSNLDTSYTRNRLRAVLPVLEHEGLSASRLAEAAGKLGRARAALDEATNALLARAVMIHPAGFARLDRALFNSVADELAMRALGRVVTCIGGKAYAPRTERLDRLWHTLRTAQPARPRTLAGCRILPADDGILICREAAAARERLDLQDGLDRLWDGRFLVMPARLPGIRRRRATVAALGQAGWRQIAKDPALRATPIPAPARAALPAFFDREGVLAVPHLGYGREAGLAYTSTAVRFMPRNMLAPARFTVA